MTLTRWTTALLLFPLIACEDEACPSGFSLHRDDLCVMVQTNEGESSIEEDAASFLELNVNDKQTPDLVVEALSSETLLDPRGDQDAGAEVFQIIIGHIDIPAKKADGTHWDQRKSDLDESLPDPFVCFILYPSDGESQVLACTEVIDNTLSFDSAASIAFEFRVHDVLLVVVLDADIHTFDLIGGVPLTLSSASALAGQGVRRLTAPLFGLNHLDITIEAL
jgi:hypothetical protein